MSFKKKIFYRIFPTEKLHLDLLKIDAKCNKVYVRYLQDLARNACKNEASYWEFKTNGVFFNMTQEKVYTEVKEGLLDNVIKGYNAVIIAFGQTGTGKTFTTSGLHFSEEEFGVAPRIARDLLELRRTQPSNIKMCIQMSYVELNNNLAIDLLKDLPNSLVNYKCREATKVGVSTEFEALKCLFLGEGRKNFIENNSQYLSNLCSTVVTFHITSKNMDLTNPTKMCSRVHVVDLAGTDSCAHGTALHKNPKEIGLANVTKSQLEQFILRLSEIVPETIRIQQRMNILLYYLDGDFSCDNILRFIGHIRAKREDMLVTLSMLRFGNVIQGLRTRKKHIKFDMNEEVELEYLRKKLDSYDKEKHLNSVLLNIDLVSGLNQPRTAHLNNLIQNYLSNDIGEITLINVADTQTVLRNMKDICTGAQNELKKLKAENYILSTQHHSDTSLKHRSSKASSQGSSSKMITRKSSKVKSRESFTTNKDKKASVSTIASDSKRYSDEHMVSHDSNATKSRKKSRSTSIAARTLIGKKKSSITSVNRQESKGSIPSNPDYALPIPDFVPAKKDVWKQYSTNASYKERVEEYRLNEKDVRDGFATYVKEVMKLQNCKENVNKCSNDLITAQTFRKFNRQKDEYDKEGFLLISYAEKQCKEHLDEAYRAQVYRQEIVLRCQEMLKVYLENRQHIIHMINQEFDKFCRENYKIPSSTSQEMEDDLKNITFNVNLENPEESLEDIEEIVQVPGVSENTQMLRKLRKLLAQGIEDRKRIMNKQRHKWNNS